MKCFKLIIAFLIVTMLAFPVFSATASTAIDSPELSYESYTYWQDYAGQEKKAVYCKPMYEPAFAIDYKYLGASSLTEINDVCTDKNGNVYILDSGAGVIYVLDKEYNYLSRIDVIKNSDG